MSSTVERAALGLVLFALGAAGWWTRYGAGEGPAEPARAAARPRRARAEHDPASVRSSALDAAWTSEDGGAELDPVGDDDLVCWTVRTVDPRGAPLAALVLVVAQGRDGAAREVRTAGDTGQAEVCTLAYTELWVDAWADDGAWGRVATWIEGPEDLDDPSDPAPPVTVEVMLAAPPAVVGRVVDARGAPVAGVRVELVDHWGGDVRECRSPRTLDVTGREAWHSDADGRFELPIGVLGYFRVCADAPGFVPVGSAPFPARPGGRTEVELVLAPAVELRGLVAHRGRPVRVAHVYADWEGGSAHVGSEDGTFAFGGLPADARVDVYVAADGFVAHTFAQLAPGEHRLELERGGTLEVQVDVARELATCDAAGAPRLVVHVRTPEGELLAQHGTDAPDPIVIPDLPAGPLSVRAWATGAWAEAEVDVEAGATSRARLRLAPDIEQGILRLTVTGRGDLTGPLPAVRITRDDALEIVDVLQGDVHCTALPPGRYRLHAYTDHLAGEGMADVRAAARTDVTLHLGPGEPPADRAWWEPGGGHFCEVPFSTVRIDERTYVAAAAPSVAGLLPGDELLLPDDDPYLEGGREGSLARFAVRRGDGTVQQLAVPRTRCE